MNDLWTLSDGLAAIFAVIAGLFGTYKLGRKWWDSQPRRKLLSIFAGTNALRDDLLKLRGRTINFDTALDFSVWDDLSNRIAQDTEYRSILHGPGSDLNGRRLPLYIATQHETLDSFASLVVSVKDGSRLKFSYGGTGVVQALLKGRFEVEVRDYSGSSVEITLREVA